MRFSIGEEWAGGIRNAVAPGRSAAPSGCMLLKAFVLMRSPRFTALRMPWLLLY
jgi:hypothetical protein